ncbi:hypothetical protein ACFOKF_21910 [Sphingobium rhizovicinum]|uniref:Uncharacterized protein n=1 Tax=Sphingobium rhizovicinum TaxID=432308 RepID=A0ABV7NN05_9SPHN
MTLIEIFIALLGDAGWEVQNLRGDLGMNIAIDPAAIARRTEANVTLEAQLSPDDHELKLFILDHADDKLVRLALSVDENSLRLVLERLILEQAHLDHSTFPDFLHYAHGYTDRIWFVDHHGTRFMLEFDAWPAVH